MVYPSQRLDKVSEYLVCGLSCLVYGSLTILPLSVFNGLHFKLRAFGVRNDCYILRPCLSCLPYLKFFLSAIPHIDL